ncbi:hypothetical protein X942_5264 [Burkholderia pseudomallei MSHR5596]|nr:hypothetical protein X942_5264 [Burkholderia pseudomallei MSHR5596]
MRRINPCLTKLIIPAQVVLQHNQLTLKKVICHIVHKANAHTHKLLRA